MAGDYLSPLRVHMYYRNSVLELVTVGGAFPSMYRDTVLGLL
jgi:hypothetical protein